ncbi:MAG: cupin domain-containing protein [Proteobacteria bacterium]|nr:cupin domain-containing protein [Pseudomonadota bacterium]
MTVPPFPGAVGASHLRVYESEAPDGLCGGTPHVHSVCTEAYFVVAGRGSVQTIDAQGYRETPLEPGAFVWFTPGTIHRLINGDGALEILVLMQNAGLPEAGDMIISFAPEVLDDPDAYARAHALPEAETTTRGDGHAARTRRDAGVAGFLPLRDAVLRGDRRPLERFYAQAARLLAPRAADWKRLYEAGPLAEVQETGRQIAAVARGDSTHLAEASLQRLAPPPAERRMGCCGTLGVYVAADAEREEA